MLGYNLAIVFLSFTTVYYFMLYRLLRKEAMEFAKEATDFAKISVQHVMMLEAKLAFLKELDTTTKKQTTDTVSPGSIN